VELSGLDSAYLESEGEESWDEIDEGGILRREHHAMRHTADSIKHKTFGISI
jgi:hypothetical protein